MTKRRRPWIPELHPRDARGRFAKRGGGESKSSWERAVANRASPGVRVQKPQRGELPGGARTITELMHKMKSGEVSWYDKDTVDRLTGYFDRTTSMNDPGSGLRVRVAKVSTLPNGGININYVISDSFGIKVGSADRQWKIGGGTGDTTVAHSYFGLNSDVLGGGLAARWNHNNEDVYRANGASAIYLNANISVGGYAWAKQGYDFSGPGSMEQVRDRFDKLADVHDYRQKEIRLYLQDYDDYVAQYGVDGARSVYPDREVAEMRAKVMPPLSQQVLDRIDDLVERSTIEHWKAGTAPTPLEWAMVGWTPGATDWPGKRFMLGSSWDGVKYL